MARRTIRIPVRITTRVRRQVRWTGTVRTHPVYQAAPEPLAIEDLVAGERCDAHQQPVAFDADGSVTGCCDAFVQRVKSSYGL